MATMRSFKVLSGKYKVKGEGKFVPMLNRAPRHEDILGIGNIAPHILNFGARCR